MSYDALGGAHASLRNEAARDGKFRAVGCFGHPILAGTFGAISLPIRRLVVEPEESQLPRGLVPPRIIVLAANSSTPLLALLEG